MNNNMRIFIGNFTENQVRNGEDKRAVENTMKLSSLKYVKTEFVCRKLLVYEVYLTNEL